MKKTQPSASLRGSPTCTGGKVKPSRRRLSRRSQASAACPECGAQVVTFIPHGGDGSVFIFAVHGWNGQVFCEGSRQIVGPPKSANMGDQPRATNEK